MAGVTDLKITTAAVKALQQALARIGGQRVATVVWSTAGAIERPLSDGTVSVKSVGPGWDVGFYEIERIPKDQVVQIEGIRFYFDQGSISERLNGATLDFENGGFIVANAAI
jgi:hypothetical protein